MGEAFSSTPPRADRHEQFVAPIMAPFASLLVVGTP